MKHLQCRVLVCFVLSGLTAGAAATSYSAGLVIETVAGSGQPGDLPAGGGAALTVPVEQPFGAECGPDGALYITSVGQHRVLRLDRKTGELTSVAGDGA